MSALSSPGPSSHDDLARAWLDRVRGRFGAIPAELLVARAVAVAAEADVIVGDAALDALQRRWAFAERDELRIATRPATVLGDYTTSRGREVRAPRPRGARTSRDRGPAPVLESRPYTTTVTNLEPLGASCDCPDFVRSSLGLCKHALVVFDAIFAEGASLARAKSEHANRPRLRRPRLDWHPALPLAGELDRLSGLRLSFPIPEDAEGALDPTLQERLRQKIGEGVIESVRHDPARRRELLVILRSLVESHRTAKPLLDASPGARAIVREELARAERLFANDQALAPALASLQSLKRALYPYQREGVERFLAAGRLLLADDMGLGKTTQAIACCHALVASGQVMRGLVIAPASLKSQWLREWSETTAVPLAIVDGPPEVRAAQYRKLRRGFLVLNYEQLLRDAELVRAIRPDVVVLDEAQRIKNYATKSAVEVKALEPTYRLVLTGTPMENRLEELASILDWVDDVALSPKWRLVPWYTPSVEGEGIGARNLDTLRQRLAPCLLRRVRKEVLAQLPPRTDTRVPVEMTPQQIAEHEELNQPIARLVQSSRTRPLTQPEFLALMQLLTQQRIIANGLGQLRFEELWPTYSQARPDKALLEGLFAPKLTELRRLLADLVVAQGRKVVVFSQWRRMLRLAEWSVRDILGDAGVRSVFFTGAEKTSQRTASLVDFHDDPRVCVMFLSDAGGVGLNLQAAASACINLELPWNPAVVEQRVARIYRHGQTRPIDVYNLVAERSIEERIAATLGAKQALFAGLFDGATDEVKFDGTTSFIAEVERLLDGRSGNRPGAAPPARKVPAVVYEPPADDDPGVQAGADQSARTDAALGDEIFSPPATSHEPPHASPADADALLRLVRVERTRDGGVRIEAPPGAADLLVTLLDKLGAMIRGAT